MKTIPTLISKHLTNSKCHPCKKICVTALSVMAWEIKIINVVALQLQIQQQATGLKMELYCAEFDMDRVDVPIVELTSVALEILETEKLMCLLSHRTT